MTLIAMFTTVESSDDARRLARMAVESGLAACVQMEPIDSVYAWQGRIEQSAEIRLTFKTTAGRGPELLRRIVAAHPYELPAVWSVEVADASAAYLEWVQRCTSNVDPRPDGV